jgi:VWFA-related protein
MIVFDEDSLEAENGLVARRAALALVDGLSPFDRVGVNLIPRVRGRFTLTSDRAEIRKTLNGWVPGTYREMPGRYWIGLSEAIDIARQDRLTRDKVVLRECPPKDVYCPIEIVDEARLIAERSAERGTLTLEALRDLAAGLRKIPGPKVLVLVSGGMPKPESTFDFDGVAREFAASEITLYTLFIEKAASSKVRYRQSPTQDDDDRLEQFELGNTTSVVGGTFVQVIGQVEPHFQRIAAELAASYLLGIEVDPADRDGCPHRVTIKANRRDLDVRGRKQYVIAVPK